LSIDAGGNGVTTSRTHSSSNNGPMNNIETQVDDDVAEEHNHVIPEAEESVVAEKRATDELKPSASDVNANDITTSRTHSSTNNGPMNAIEVQVDDDGPGVQKHTFPETKKSVVAEKHATDELATPSGDAVDIATSRNCNTTNNDATDVVIAQVDSNVAEEHNHTIHEAEESVVAERK